MNNESNRQIAFLEAQLKEIQASREEMHRALLERAYEPVQSKSRVWGPVAVVMSLAAVGLAVFGLVAFMGTSAGLDVEPVYQDESIDETVAVVETGPVVDGVFAPSELVDVALEAEPVKETPKPPVTGKGRGRGTRGQRTNPPPAVKDDLDFGDCGLDPLCGGEGGRSSDDQYWQQLPVAQV